MKKKIAIQIAASLAAALLAAALPAPAQTPSTAKPGAPAGRKEQVKPAPAGSPYHFSAADWGRMILFRNAAPETSVLPNPAALPAGWYVDIDRLGAGAVTILPPPGAMLDGSPHGALQLNGGTVTLPGQTSGLSAATLTPNGPSNLTYRISANVTCDATSSSTVTPKVEFTDPSGTAQTVAMGTADCSSLGSSSMAQKEILARVKALTAIQYLTTVATPPTHYDLTVSAQPLSAN